MKPHAPACDRNRDPILEALKTLLPAGQAPVSVLEIGSGTGQHAVYFAARLPRLEWQTSDRAEQLAGIRLWLDEAALPNLPAPVELDVDRFGVRSPVDMVFSANTAHIMGASSVASMFRGVGTVLREGGVFVLYGPFMRNGRHTSESNRRFDASLRARDAGMGLRDLSTLDGWADTAGLSPLRVLTMPANNLIAVWRRR